MVTIGFTRDKDRPFDNFYENLTFWEPDMGLTISKINLFFEKLPDQLRANRIWVGLFFLFATGRLQTGSYRQ
jgi:hypothetical protein